MSENVSALRVAVAQETLRDVITRITLRGLPIEIEALHDESLRMFAASLLADGRISGDELNAFCYEYQAKRLNTLLRERTTKRKR